MKRITSLILVICMILSAIVFASCSDKTEDNPESQGTSFIAEEDTETEEIKPTHSVPDNLDFQSADFTVNYFSWQGYSYYFFADEETGDVMNDSIYKRKLFVEEYLNVKLGQKDSGHYDNQIPEVKRSIAAGDDAYQAVLLHCIAGVSEFGSSNYMYNFDDLPYIDYSANWWNHAIMDELRLGTRTVYGVSDYMLPCPYIIVYNKDVISEYGMENPYEAVYSGTWTLDKFLKMAQDSTIDLTGDGSVSHDDIHGIGYDEWSKLISFMTGCDQFMTSRDDENHVYLDMNTEKMADIVQKFYDTSSVNGVFFELVPQPKADTKSAFKSGHIEFLLTPMSELGRFRDADIDVGVLPYPKYNENQENYISLDWGGLMCVPSTIRDADMVGAVLELLAYKSGDTVIPTYYDIMLDGKIARDEDSIKMFDILFDTIAYEIGGNYFGFTSGISDLFYALPQLIVSNKSPNFESFYAKKEKSAARAIDKFYDGME